MTATAWGRCMHPGCFRSVTDGYHRCWLHTIPEPVNAPQPTYPSDAPMPEGVTEVEPW